jgi:molecular chaperone DnaK (HSP70)
MAKAVGIDLGTTNSVVAVMESGESTAIVNSEGSVLRLRWWPSQPGERPVGQLELRA